MTREAPSRRKRSAIAYPMPDDPPVIMHVRPDSRLDMQIADWAFFGNDETYVRLCALAGGVLCSEKRSTDDGRVAGIALRRQRMRN